VQRRLGLGEIDVLTLPGPALVVDGGEHGGQEEAR
jgi:hypothetical protein